MTVDLGSAVRLYIDGRRGAASPQTLAWYESRLARLVAELGTEQDVRGVTLVDLRGWRAALAEQTGRWQSHPHVPEQRGALAQHTLDGHWRAVGAFFRWCEREGLVEESPARRLERPRRATIPPKRLQREDVLALVAAAEGRSARDAALVRVLLATGVRLAEVAGLTRGALDLREGRAEVYGKGSKTRVVYFDARTAATVRCYLAERTDTRPALWLRLDGSAPLAAGGVRSAIRSLCAIARIEQIGPHALRHTFAYEFLRAGGNPDLLRAQLGHSRLETTYNNYVRWLDEDRRRALATCWLDQLAWEGGSGTAKP